MSLGDPAMGETFVPTDEHFCAIGKVADAWATLEMNINTAIWKLMDVEQRVGACTTAQIGSFVARMRALISLAAYRGADEATIKILNRFSSDGDALARQRNRVLHDAWFGQHGTRAPHQFVATADKKLDFGFKPVPTADLTKLMEKIQRHISFFHFTMGNLFDSLPAFSPERFAKSEGITPVRQ